MVSPLPRAGFPQESHTARNWVVVVVLTLIIPVYPVHSIKISVVSKMPENTSSGSAPHGPWRRGPKKAQCIVQLGLEACMEPLTS